MDTTHKTASASIHARLTHPVIDADGHWIEFEPTLLDYLKQVGYPTLALFFQAIKDPEVQGAAYRAYNLMAADMFRGLGDRLIPAACIPLHTPAEALAELDVAVNRLGLKALMMTSLLRRPIAAAQTEGATNRYATWPDTLGIDSEYDYDPVWAKCVELKVVPTIHTAAQGIGTRVSYSNFVYNHIGHFAAAGEAVCKSLFLTGVTRRFPTLKFAFLEGGVGWACMLYSDLIGHWKKRNLQALDNTNPANLNLGTLTDCFQRYGTESLTAHLDQLDSLCHLLGDVEAVDDFA